MTVVNKRTHKPTSNDVYIGRGSIWGNPYVIGKDGNRADVINMYKEEMDYRIAQHTEYWNSMLKQLDGKTLVCYCKPLACHGDVLEEFIKEMKERI